MQCKWPARPLESSLAQASGDAGAGDGRDAAAHHALPRRRGLLLAQHSQGDARGPPQVHHHWRLHRSVGGGGDDSVNICLIQFSFIFHVLKMINLAFYLQQDYLSSWAMMFCA